MSDLYAPKKSHVPADFLLLLLLLFFKMYPVTWCDICCLSAGAYLSPGFHYPVYGKMSGREEAEKVNTSPSINTKTASEAKALDLLQHHANQYRSKSPAVSLLLLVVKRPCLVGEGRQETEQSWKRNGLETQLGFQDAVLFQYIKNGILKYKMWSHRSGKKCHWSLCGNGEIFCCKTVVFFTYPGGDVLGRNLKL